MDQFDDRLRFRLERLEAALPLPARRPSRRSVRLPLSVVGAIAAVALLAGAAGATAISGAVRSSAGVFAPGGALACSRIQEMPPREAAEVLAQLGYQVTWQVEDMDTGTSVETAIAPEDGYIIEGVLQRTAMLLVVERGANAFARQPCQ